jgi:hypothetical protein
MVPILISLLIDQMRGTSHESQTAWVGCLDRRTNQSCPHRRTHQSCPNRHGEHINPGLTGELIILQHRRANHPVPQESESSCPTRERIILFHKRANHLVPQESESSCSSAHHQGRVSHPVVVCCSSNNRKPPRAPRAQCMQHAGPFYKDLSTTSSRSGKSQI